MKEKLKEQLKSLGVSFGLLYATILFAVWSFNSLSKIGEEEFLVVDISRKEQEEMPRICAPVQKRDEIEIPKLGIRAPLVFSENLEQGLNKGVVHYPESNLPGEEGAAIFLGHSAPVGWPKINYDWVFSDIEDLEQGDEIYVVFENCRYTYSVEERMVLEKGQEIPPSLTGGASKLVVISCWPPGKDYKRMAVSSSLVKE